MAGFRYASELQLFNPFVLCRKQDVRGTINFCMNVEFPSILTCDVDLRLKYPVILYRQASHQFKIEIPFTALRPH